MKVKSENKDLIERDSLNDYGPLDGGEIKTFYPFLSSLYPSFASLAPNVAVLLFVDLYFILVYLRSFLNL